MDKKVVKKVKDEVKDMELTDDMFVGFNELGEKQIFYKLLEFDSSDGDHYLAYTDRTKVNKGNTKVYGSKVLMDEDGVQKFEAITDEKVWNVIDKAISAITSGSKESIDE